ncbi:MAG: DUF3578 domain-containing protein [Bacteroidota bacterium]
MFWNPLCVEGWSLISESQTLPAISLANLPTSSLREAFERVLATYGAARDEPFAGHPLASVLRRDIPAVLRGWADRSVYRVRGSAGPSTWAACPWIAVFDKAVTVSARRGFYVVYLVSVDQSGVYLALVHGVLDAMKDLRGDAKPALERMTRASRDLLRPIELLRPPKMNLAPPSPDHLAAFYEQSAVTATFYPATQVPDDAQLKRDLDTYLGYYRFLRERRGLGA